MTDEDQVSVLHSNGVPSKDEFRVDVVDPDVLNDDVGLTEDHESSTDDFSAGAESSECLVALDFHSVDGESGFVNDNINVREVLVRAPG